MNFKAWHDRDSLIQSVVMDMEYGIWANGEPDVPDANTRIDVITKVVDHIISLSKAGAIPAVRFVRNQVSPGDVVNGEHWSFSARTMLEDAEKFFGSGYVGVIFSRLPLGKIDLPQTVSLQILFPHEKEIFVNKPVKVEQVISMDDWKSRTDYWEKTLGLSDNPSLYSMLYRLRGIKGAI